ncbi:MAG: Ig-like domain repeat protein, partial [Chloroflexi bacterium]|nr:Ig-like domain repeat protein [Chloroflexota bacterium]
MGGAIYNTEGSHSTLQNGILWGNTAGSGGPQLFNTSNGTNSATINYSLVEGGCPAGATCDAHLLSGDPLFTSASDLHLGSGSPAINAGYNSYVPAGLTTDLDGNPRFAPVGGVVDMGAYEYPSLLSATITLGGLNPTYDGTPKAAIATTDPAGLTVVITYDGSPTAPTDAGSYTVEASISDPNYEGSASGTLVIAKALLTVTADDKSRGYGQPNPELTVSYSGFVNGETQSVLSGAPSLNTTATESSPVGAYPITVTAGTLSAANYSFTFVDGTLTVIANPVPSLTGLSPTSATAGVAEFTLTVNGTGFVSGATVQWNGSNLSTSYVSATQLNATIPAANIASAGVAYLTAVNPGPTAASNPLAFYITEVVATVTASNTASGEDPSATTGATRVTASATGNGTLSVAEYATNPAGTPTFNSSSAYIDVHVAPGNSFTTVSIVDCNLNGGTLVFWWNGTTWALASNQSYDSGTGCVTITVSASTSPSLTDLTGTVFGAGSLATPAVAVASSQNPSTAGQSVTFNATVMGGFGTPTGSATFKDGGAVISGCDSVPLDSGGQASCTTSTLPIGERLITAVYSGDANYAGATGTLSPNQQVNCASAITVASASDSGPGSLRQAIANVCADGTITFNSDYTIHLASQLTISKNLTIDGAGHNVTVSGDTDGDGTGNVRVLQVNSGVTFNLNGLTIAKGNAGGGFGG